MPNTRPQVAQRLKKEYDALQRSLRVIGRETGETQTREKQLQHLLTDALKEMPPGDIRALAQIEIERAYGSMRKRKGLKHPHTHPEDHLLAEALHHFQAILHSIHEADAYEQPKDAATELQQAVEQYAQFLAHLADDRREHIEHAILQQYAL